MGGWEDETIPTCSHDDAANPESERCATRKERQLGDSKYCTPTTTIVTGLQHWGRRRGIRGDRRAGEGRRPELPSKMWRQRSIVMLECSISSRASVQAQLLSARSPSPVPVLCKSRARRYRWCSQHRRLLHPCRRRPQARPCPRPLKKGPPHKTQAQRPAVRSGAACS